MIDTGNRPFTGIYSHVQIIRTIVLYFFTKTYIGLPLPIASTRELDYASHTLYHMLAYIIIIMMCVYTFLRTQMSIKCQ